MQRCNGKIFTKQSPSTMRLVLHLGLGKTGTTALQQSLSLLRPALLEHGILYPKLDSNRPDHNAITLGLLGYEYLARGMKYLCNYEAAKAEEVFARIHACLVAQIAEHKPHTLVLSSENLCRGPVRFTRRDPIKYFSALADEIVPVIYVRKPSARYLSLAQQVLKASGKLLCPRPEGFKRILQDAEAVYRVRPVALVSDRSKFKGGDIAQDFIRRLLPSAVDVISLPHGTVANTSMSAEAMSIMQEYRWANHADSDGKFTPDTSRVLRTLHELDADGSSPKLLPEVARFVDEVSIDLLWLREEYGIQFDEIDYAALRPAHPGERESYQTFTRVDQICHVDSERKHHLLMKTLNALASAS